MPTHYAASEMLILLVALWTAQALWRHKIFYGALGIVLFGTAAALGAIRFGLSLNDDNLTTLHRFASQFGGLVGVILFCHELIIGTEKGRKWRLWHTGFASLMALTALLFPMTRVPLFLFWLAGLIVLCAGHTPHITLRIPVKMALAGIMLANVVLVRQAPWLRPEVSWHAFHIFVAIWLLAIYALLTVRNPQAGN